MFVRRCLYYLWTTGMTKQNVQQLWTAVMTKQSHHHSLFLLIVWDKEFCSKIKEYVTGATIAADAGASEPMLIKYGKWQELTWRIPQNPNATSRLL